MKLDGEETPPLPRGHHRLSRRAVIGSQRMRIMTAMADAIAERGYGRTTVSDVLDRAAVSREIFYREFPDKLTCFLAAYETVVEVVLARMIEALLKRGGDPAARFDRALAAYLGALAEEPALARAFLVEIYAAGPTAIARRMELHGRFVDVVARVFGAKTRRDRFACEMLIGGMSTLVTAKVGTGAMDELPALRAPIMDLMRRIFEPT